LEENKMKENEIKNNEIIEVKEDSVK